MVWDVSRAAHSSGRTAGRKSGAVCRECEASCRQRQLRPGLPGGGWHSGQTGGRGFGRDSRQTGQPSPPPWGRRDVSGGRTTRAGEQRGRENGAGCQPGGTQFGPGGGDENRGRLSGVRGLLLAAGRKPETACRECEASCRQRQQRPACRGAACPTSNRAADRKTRGPHRRIGRGPGNVKGNRKGIDTSPGRAAGVRRRRGALPRPARGPGCSTWNILCLSSLLPGGPVSGRRSPAARRSSAARWAALDVPRGTSPVFLPFAGGPVSGWRRARGGRSPPGRRGRWGCVPCTPRSPPPRCGWRGRAPPRPPSGAPPG